MKNVLVVGGAGFIGSQVNKMLDQAGYQTIVLDNLSRGHRHTVVHGTFIEGDLGDRALLNKIFTQYTIDAVMHFAAFIDVGESVIEPAKYYQNNVINTFHLLDVMKKHSILNFIFSSSAAVYGLPQKKQIEETHPCLPINPYGETKLMVEKILHDFYHAYGLKSCSLRYFNAAGGDPDGEIKNFNQKPSNLIPIILKSLKKNEAITIFGTDYSTPDGTCIRDYIHVFDLGSAHISAMERLWNGAPTSCYNLGNGEGYSIREVIESVKRVTKLNPKVIEGKRREGDPPFLVANCDKARDELNWKPKFGHLDFMVEHAWKAMFQ
jgi:UDP-glucose 4-epimerase